MWWKCSILSNRALGQSSSEVWCLTSPKDSGYVESEAIILFLEDLLLCSFLALSCPLQPDPLKNSLAKDEERLCPPFPHLPGMGQFPWQVRTFKNKILWCGQGHPDPSLHYRVSSDCWLAVRICPHHREVSWRTKVGLLPWWAKPS